MKKTILITGASSGIGRATATLFHEKGWNVIATMRKPAEEKELNQLDGVLVTQLDVTDAASISTAVAKGIQHFGKIDALLNNAGFGAYGPLEATPLEIIKQQFETNVIGLLQTSKAIIPHFRENKGGVMVNVSSMGGKIAFPLGTLYHGTKFAVEGLSEALRYEMAAIGVKVKVVEPGMTNTDFGGRSFSFNNDEKLTEYQGVVNKVMKGFEAAAANGAAPSVVADVIYQAVTDDGDQLRDVAGEDAKALLAKRKAEPDEQFLQGIKEMFGL